jgi:hypothetical protein
MFSYSTYEVCKKKARTTYTGTFIYYLLMKKFRHKNLGWIAVKEEKEKYN